MAIFCCRTVSLSNCVFLVLFLGVVIWCSIFESSYKSIALACDSAWKQHLKTNAGKVTQAKQGQILKSVWSVLGWLSQRLWAVHCEVKDDWRRVRFLLSLRCLSWRIQCFFYVYFYISIQGILTTNINQPWLRLIFILRAQIYSEHVPKSYRQQQFCSDYLLGFAGRTHSIHVGVFLGLWTRIYSNMIQIWGHVDTLSSLSFSFGSSWADFVVSQHALPFGGPTVISACRCHRRSDWSSGVFLADGLCQEPKTCKNWRLVG